MNSTFDAESFLHGQTEQAGSTKISPYPDGDYVATIEDVGARSGVIGKGDRQGETWIALELTYKLQDLPGSNLDEISQNIGRTDRMVRQSYFLDTTPEGGIDMGEGKNVRLNRVRDAVGQNVSGQPWSPAMLKGAGPLIIRVVGDPDDNDPEVVYNRVTRAAPMGSGNAVV